MLGAVTRGINWVLEKVFGTLPSGDRRVRLWTQNLNEDRQGNVKGWAWHGRCALWIHSGKYGRSRTIRFSWNLWSRFCGVEASVGGAEEDLHFFWALPPFAFWLSFEDCLPKSWKERWRKSKRIKAYNQKYEGYGESHAYTPFNVFNIRIHDWTLHWDFFKFDWGWSSKMPKWMDGSFNIPDFFLGRSKYSTEVLSMHEVLIPMPEGNYPARVKMDKSTWKRPRWPFAKVRYGAMVDMRRSIPFEGKGENSWDCGEDALFGKSCLANNVEDAIASTVKSVLQSRRKHNHNVMAKYPDPMTRPVVELRD